MNRPKKILVLSMLLLSSSFINAVEKKDTISLEQASEMVRLETKGKVLSAKTTNFNGIKAHRIQILTPSGRVKIFQIPLHRENLIKQLNRNQRYSHDRINNRSNHSNYRTPNSHTTSKNHSTRSRGENNHK